MTTSPVSNDIMRRQLNMIGSWTFSITGQDDCARFVVKHNLPIDKFITHKFKLEDADAAYELFDLQRIGKGVLVPS